MSADIEAIINDSLRTDIYFSKASDFEKTKEFVKEVCAGRCETHGFNHMDKIANLASYIADKENLNSAASFDCVIIALLHDVADHKYDNGDLKKKLEAFLDENFQEKKEFYLNAVDRISYSKEVKNGKEWLETLGADGLVIRNVVSDADKLEAIGKNGLERCYQYGRSQGLDIDEASAHVVKHAEEKLLKLAEHFIRTKTGKELAEKLHKEMESELIYY